MTRINNSMAAIADQFTAEQWEALGGDAYYSKALERQNAAQIKADRAGRWIIPAAIFAGMAFCAWMIIADPIGRTVDGIINPHSEGF